jgi:hypothetical protein
VVQVVGGLRLASEPLIDDRIRLIQDNLEVVELGGIHVGKVLVGEIPQKQIGFLGSAMPASKRQAFAPRGKIVTHLEYLSAARGLYQEQANALSRSSGEIGR